MVPRFVTLGDIMEISHLLVFRVNLQAQATKLVASCLPRTKLTHAQQYAIYD
jgi:hypothetical protein